MPLVLIFILLYHTGSTQTAPFYGDSQSFITGFSQAALTVDDIQTFSRPLPTGFQISTNPNRKPFYGVSSVQNVEFENSTYLYWIVRIKSYTSTGLVFELENMKITSGTTIIRSYGFVLNSVIKFRYLLVRNIFPAIYFSRHVYFVNVPKTVNAGINYQQNFTLSTLTSPSPAPLTIKNQTVFLHSMIDFDLNSLHTVADGYVGIKFSIIPISGTQFGVILTSKYKITLSEVGLMIFMFNPSQLFAQKIKIEFETVNFTSLPTGAGAQRLNYYNASYFPSTINSFYYGVSSLEFASESKVGFEFAIDTVFVGTNFTIVLRNLLTTAAIPRLQIMLFLTSELRCPAGLGFLDQAQTICYSACPSTTYQSTIQAGITGLFYCVPCIATCLTCAVASNKCQTCDPLQNREINTTLQTCPPKSHFYDDGTPIAKECDANCVQCLTLPTTCTKCSSNAYLSAAKTCIPCADIYTAHCLTCTPTACLTCSQPDNLIHTTGQCITCTFYDPQCSTCTTSTCSTCTLTHFLSLLPTPTCKPCTDYHAKCLTCNTTACKSCVAPEYQVSVTSGCVKCTDFDVQCMTCTGTVCQSCNVGFYLDAGGKCGGCTVWGGQCAECDATACTKCAVGYIVGGNGSCLTCTDYHAQCELCSAASCTQCADGFVVSSNGSCLECTGYHAQCEQCTSTACTQCSLGFTVSANGSSCMACTDFHTSCQQCTSTACSKCADGFIMSVNGSCLACTDHHPQCQQCTATTCTQCADGFIISANGSSCMSCTSYHSQCQQCTSTTCTQCTPGFTISLTSTSCLACTTHHPSCTTCTATTCHQCSPGYFPTGQSCQQCNTTYTAQCLTCNQTSCVECVQGYMIDGGNGRCFVLECGDGQWVEGVEGCDDGNREAGDGCSAECGVEEGWVCLWGDRRATGEAVCKYTKEITLDFISLQKHPDSNTLQLLFHLSPPHLRQWNPTTIKSLIHPLEIVDPQSNVSLIIPEDNIHYTFNPINGEVEVVIDYGGKSIEGKHLKFDINPGLTDIEAIRDLNKKTDLLVRLQSVNGQGEMLYAYSDEQYAWKAMLEKVSLVVGMLALIMLALGFCLPVGKLIIIESLAVIQLVYFSVFQFTHIPPTFIPIKNLIYSNGFNEVGIVGGSGLERLSVERLMGWKGEGVGNFNVGLVGLVVLPLMMGGIGLLVMKSMASNIDQPNTVNTPTPSKGSPLPDTTPPPSSQRNSNPSKLQQQQQEQQPLTSSQSLQKQNKHLLVKIIFSRIAFQTTFYGLIVCGYLSFMSVLSSLYTSTVDYAFAGVVAVVWVGVVGLFVKVKTRVVDLRGLMANNGNNKVLTNKLIDPSKNIPIPPPQSPMLTLTNFGQFTPIYQQISPSLSLSNKHPSSSPQHSPSPSLSSHSRLYLLLPTQHLLTSLFITLLPNLTTSSLISLIAIITIYMVLLLSLVVGFYRGAKVGKEEDGSEGEEMLHGEQEGIDKNKQIKRKGMVSYLFKNYTLRQVINFSTVIVVEVLFLMVELMVRMEGMEHAFVDNAFISKWVPAAVLVLVLCNMCWNAGLWVHELRREGIMDRTKVMLMILFPSLKFTLSTPTNNSPNPQTSTSPTPSIFPTLSPSHKNSNLLTTTDPSQQNQLQQLMQSYMQSSPIFKSKHSPFLGVQEKQSHYKQRQAMKENMDVLLDDFRLEQGDEENGNQGRKYSKELESFLFANNNSIDGNYPKTHKLSQELVDIWDEI